MAFPLVKKLLAFNTPQAQRVEVVVLSKNDPVSGLRVFARRIAPACRSSAAFSRAAGARTAVRIR